MLRKLIKHITIVCCTISTGVLVSQNLIQNPSFELYEDCPVKLGNFEKDVVAWSTPTLGSTDYFNACSKAMGTPENFNGKQPADFGEGYAGMYLYAPNDYREYIQVPLTQTLIKDKKYNISFYISLAERSDYAVKEFGVLLSKKQIHVPIKKELSKMHWYKDKENAFNFMEIGYTNFYKDTKDWILVNTQFVAKGNENYLIIGNFNSNAKTRKFKTKKYAKQGAYYYVDMISLTSIDNLGTDASTASDLIVDDKRTYALDEVHIFNNVLFEFDKYELLDTAKEDIRHIADYLKTDGSLSISIDGHTDTIGTREYNRVLSANRCKAVAKYLMEIGLAEERIRWAGHGGSKPIATNNTEQGRQLNRRVEFVISSPPVNK
ncbi:OmpA family protein [Muriicola sp. Z0-33]|uniref:OmpA family protein n=1 Tax=Muriicola sp. Z0-33 TaxID=2816957 RepID=UPI0022385465|nr:OmpA family protein [Muriicola sp. Z0-33]MCW5518042.1 OmpA family protein [Muriicola sp. Z0-33]